MVLFFVLCCFTRLLDVSQCHCPTPCHYKHRLPLNIKEPYLCLMYQIIGSLEHLEYPICLETPAKADTKHITSISRTSKARQRDKSKMPSSTDQNGQQSLSNKTNNHLSQEQKDKLKKAPGITPRNNESRQSKGGSKTSPGWVEPQYKK